MSSEQADQLIDSISQDPTPPQQEPIPEIPCEDAIEQADVEASQILNSDRKDIGTAEQACPPSTSVELKTRADLIKEIKRQYDLTGDDYKPLNLNRRRKKEPETYYRRAMCIFCRSTK